MQLGMDQDLPADSCAFNLAIDSLNFFVPPRSFEAGVSARNSGWWKDLMSAPPITCNQGRIYSCNMKMTVILRPHWKGTRKNVEP